MKTISIVNQKGGSGKTTTASLLCRALVQAGQKVLAIDTDPQATLTNLFGIEPQQSLFNCLSGQVETSGVVYRSDGVDLIPASIELSSIFTGVGRGTIARLLSSVKGYAYCIIDTPPNLEGLTIAAIEATDLVLVSCEASRPALPATLYTLQTLRKLRKPYKVIIAGYKEPKPDSKAYKNSLMLEYKEKLKAFAAIPKNASTAKQAETAKPTKKSKGELYPLLRGLVA